MKSLVAFLALPLACLVFAQNAVISFDCNDMPEVCNNMCWGVHCTDGLFSKSLTYDEPDRRLAARRRRAAGCIRSGGNRCTTPNFGRSGFNCDEFPFASTREADGGDQLNRCVPITQNSKQGGTLSAFYGVLKQSRQGNNPVPFDMAFKNSNAAGVKYCEDAATNPCVADSNQVVAKTNTQAPDPAKFTPRGLGFHQAARGRMHMYRGTSGAVISSPKLFDIGQPLYSFASNWTLDMAEADEAGYMQSFEMEIDHIAEILSLY